MRMDDLIQIREGDADSAALHDLDDLTEVSVSHLSQRQIVEANKLTKRLRRQVGEAISDYGMIEANDKIMVCLSGGKDSYALLDVLMALQKKAPVPFTLFAFNLDQKHPGYPAHILPEYLTKLGVEFQVAVQDTYSTVKRVIPEGKTMCSLCSRLRRGAIYRVAEEIGATKIALGHHRDDMIQTMFLNMFYGGRLKAMPPKLASDSGKHIVIRPLAYVEEQDLEAYSELKQFPIIPCDLCGSQDNLQRQQVKLMLRDWQKKFPGRIENITRAMKNIVPSHMLDRELFNFVGVTATGEADAAGDIAFDEDSALSACTTGASGLDATPKAKPIRFI
jgi:tRNA 2-thiocytidine biosynthesis protein TtcA